MKLLFTFLAALCIVTTAQAQYTDTTISPKPKREQVYKIKPWLDIPLTAAMSGWTLYGFSVVYGRDTVPFAELQALDRNKINSFDRGTTKNYSTSAKSASDYFFYGSMPLPLILLLDKKIRRDGPRVGLLYLEALSMTGTIYTLSAMSANRFRPYAYNPDVKLATRTRGGARNSFFGGHAAVVGTSTFFMAKVYADYHPEMRNKWILYSVAGAATLTTGILRIKAGQHFPTDVLVGMAIGPVVGVLVPHFHKNKNKERKLALYPNFQRDATGFTALYKLGK